MQRTVRLQPGNSTLKVRGSFVGVTFRAIDNSTSTALSPSAALFFENISLFGSIWNWHRTLRNDPLIYSLWCTQDRDFVNFPDIFPVSGESGHRAGGNLH